MANRIVDVIYRLKDQFTNQVGKITGGYRRMGDEAEKAGKRTTSAFSNTGRALSGITAAVGRLAGIVGISVGVGAATRTFSAFVDEADRLGKVASKLGYSAEELQRVGFAAERNGISFDTMAVSLQRLTRRIGEVASTGKGEAKTALDALGLSAKELSELGLEDRLAELADAMAGVADQEERVFLTQKLFDTEGVDMVRILQEGSAAFRQLTKEAEKFGRIIDQKTTKQAAEFNDTLRNVGATWDRLVVKVGGPILSELDEFTKNIGISADEVANLSTELFKVEMDLDKLNRQLESGSSKDILEYSELEKRARDLRKQLSDLTATDKKNQEQQAASQAAMKERQAQQKLLTDAVEAQSKAYEIGSKNIKAALDKETAELRAARSEQANIEREFANLVQDVAGETKDANIIDANYLKLQAQNALNSGDIDGAIEKARAAGEMLRELKQAGEGGFELGYLAKELERIATAASGKKVGQELIDVQAAQRSVDAIKQKLEELNGTKIEVELVPVVSGSGQASDAIRNAVSKRGSK